MPKRNGINVIRDDFSRVIKRIETIDGEEIVTSFRYNSCGDLTNVCVTKQDTLIREENFYYKYDVHNNKISKCIETYYTKSFLDTNTLPVSSSSSSIYHYKNDYKDNKLIKKTCFYGNEILYMNQYYYRKNILNRIEKYNKPPKLDLWCVELLEYKDNQLIKSVYLANGILSYISISDLKGDIPINRRIINPAKGKYYWLIKDCEISKYPVCSVYIGESILTGEILLEILNYIVDLKELNHDYKLLIIECSDTYVDTSDKELHDIEIASLERGISIRYSP